MRYTRGETLRGREIPTEQRYQDHGNADRVCALQGPRAPGGTTRDGLAIAARGRIRKGKTGSANRYAWRGDGEPLGDDRARSCSPPSRWKPVVPYLASRRTNPPGVRVSGLPSGRRIPAHGGDLRMER